ncbi:MAG TPA: 4-carboxy-4-hydroxy-2-oxoadipate aldolase/oxaloacetate decarboxylase [Anaerovoracaceae bacterium]|nr:4-carboxy-4-hydroxy-2-oxoadipate aldolase/oxaloacetate decarboxylase [Anaerovoracaceae bacterium]
MIHIKKSYPKPSPELIAAFLEQSTATVHEVMGKRGAMHSSVKPLASGMKACGPALTVKSHAGDNIMVLKALDLAREGDMLVIDVGQLSEEGPWGEITTVQAQLKKVAGLVIDGSVRDSMEIKQAGFPVFCKGVSIVGTAKASLGLINHPISCGNIIVNPGDIILADEDGVVVIPLAEAEEVLVKSRERVATELTYIERMKAGESLWAISKNQAVLDSKGCIEE